MKTKDKLSEVKGRGWNTSRARVMLLTRLRERYGKERVRSHMRLVQRAINKVVGFDGDTWSDEYFNMNR